MGQSVHSISADRSDSRDQATDSKANGAGPSLTWLPNVKKDNGAKNWVEGLPCEGSF